MVVVVGALLGGAVPAAGQAPPGSGSRPPAPGGRLTTPVFSARRVPELLRARPADDALRAAVGKALAGAPPDTCVVVTEGGRRIVDVQGDRALLPASTNKLLTGLAALEALGPDTRLRTVAASSVRPGPDGVLAGDLYLVGGGDPLLFTPGFRVTLKDQNQPGTDFAVLADRIRAAGVTRITGRILGDDSRYDQVRGVPTWPSSYQKEDQVGALSALEVNRGISGLSKAPDKPATRRLIGDPVVLGAETLRSLLVARGVAVDGDAAGGQAPAGATELASLDSLPVRDIVAEMLLWSDNTTAELLTKELGRTAGGAGTTAAGLAATEARLRAAGLPLPSLHRTDGSGLDRDNRIACSTLAALLDRVGPGSPLTAGLPVAGKSGTLRPRLRGTPADGVVTAKTGTLKDVSALAGYATTATGATLTFAVLVNGTLPPKVAATKVDDDVAVAVTTYSGAATAALGPTPPA